MRLKNGMLGRYDIIKEIGENIYIHPIELRCIKANSIDLRASRFAWSAKTKKSIYDPVKKEIVITPNDIALIYSEEAIYVSNKIGGSYNSKVSLVSKGLSHIGTTLDNQYLGLSLIALTNHSDHDIVIKEHTQFVTLHFFYLSTAGAKNIQEHDNPPGQTSVLDGMDEASLEEFKAWADDNNWIRNKKRLYVTMKTSEEYKRFLEEVKIEKRHYTKRYTVHRTLVILLTVFITVVIGILATMIAAKCDPMFEQVDLVLLTKSVIYPLIVSAAVAVISIDFRNFK